MADALFYTICLGCTDIIRPSPTTWLVVANNLFPFLVLSASQVGEVYIVSVS